MLLSKDIENVIIDVYTKKEGERTSWLWLAAVRLLVFACLFVYRIRFLSDKKRNTLFFSVSIQASKKKAQYVEHKKCQ